MTFPIPQLVESFTLELNVSGSNSVFSNIVISDCLKRGPCPASFTFIFSRQFFQQNKWEMASA